MADRRHEPRQERWEVEYVIALAPDPASAAAARRLALAAHWTDTGCDARAVWGRYRGAHAEPYEVAVELEEAACRCTCLSRKSPCKHALGLLLLWSAQAVLDDVVRPPYVSQWLRRRPAAAPAPGPAAPAAPAGGAGPLPAGPAVTPGREPPPGVVPERAGEEAGTCAEGDDEAGVEEPSPLARADPPPDAGRRAAERAARVATGLAELDRWLTDQVRTGLADAGLHRPEPWEAMAARLVDAQAGSLANRLRRLAARVATAPDHHELVVAELGLLHLLACGGRRTVHLPGPLADAVRAAVGWTVRQDDVRALPPETDRWLVAGRSDVQEDRIVVRRTWLQGTGSGRWAMILSFAAYGQALDGGLPVGASLQADVHFYPSARPLRALLGVVHRTPPGLRPRPHQRRASWRSRAGLLGSLRSPHSAPRFRRRRSGRRCRAGPPSPRSTWRRPATRWAPQWRPSRGWSAGPSPSGPHPPCRVGAGCSPMATAACRSHLTRSPRRP